jgi:DNA-binding transcriptional MerR regulator
MRNDIKEDTWLTAAQCAKRIGLTVRALRLYEQTGLIRPRRTGKNWRLYGVNEIARLNEILTLKRLGLSLQHIARLLAGQAADLDRMLSTQNLALQDQLARVIPPFLTGLRSRNHAAIFSFCAGVMPPMPILGRSLL